jgi:hypothetical protein
MIPALFVASIRTARPALDGVIEWLLRSGVRALATGVVLVVLAVGQVGVIWNQAAILLPTVPDATCPVLKAPWETTAGYFYGCGIDEAWRLHPLSLWQATRHGAAPQQVAEALQAVTIAALVAWLAADVRRRPERRPPPVLAGARAG